MTVAATRAEWYGESWQCRKAVPTVVYLLATTATEKVYLLATTATGKVNLLATTASGKVFLLATTTTEGSRVMI